MPNNNFTFPTAPLNSPGFTGVPTAPTASPGTNTIQLATTAFVTAADNLKANIASPALTGTPTAPTAATPTTNTQIATTAFVKNAIAATPSSGWSTTGNSGINPAINFIGTTDATPINFSIAGTRQGFIGQFNIAIGRLGMNYTVDTAGYEGNICIGFNTGQSITTGAYNTIVGAGSGNDISVGEGNTIIGQTCSVPNPSGSAQLNIAGTIWGINCAGAGPTIPGNGQISIGANVPHASAIFDLTSTNKGFGLPRLTNAAILAISAPKGGLMVFNTTINHVCYYNGTTWQRVTNSPM